MSVAPPTYSSSERVRRVVSSPVSPRRGSGSSVWSRAAGTTARVPRYGARLGHDGAQAMVGQPNVRGLPEDYPVDDADSDLSPLMFAESVDQCCCSPGRGRGCCPPTSASDHSTAWLNDWPLTYDELRSLLRAQRPAHRVVGTRRRPGVSARRRPSAPAAADRTRRAEGRPCPRSLGWHWWPEPNAILSAPYDVRHPCVQRGTCMQGCNEGAKASTDLTLAARARQRRPPRHRRAGSRASSGRSRTRDGAVWIDDDGREHFQAASVVVMAANAIGTARLLRCRRRTSIPTGSPTRAGSSAPG